MPKTAVGLFKSAGVPDEVVRDIESIGFSRNEVRTLDEPPDFGLSGVMSIQRIDFEVNRHGAVETAETRAPEPHLPDVARERAVRPSVLLEVCPTTGDLRSDSTRLSASHRQGTPRLI